MPGLILPHSAASMYRAASGAFDITDLFVSDTSGAAFRYDLGAYSDVGMTTPAGDTDNVLALADQSGNGKHLTSTGTTKPTMVAGSYIHFSAGDVYLGNTSMDAYNGTALTIMFAWEVPSGGVFNPEYRSLSMLTTAAFQNAVAKWGTSSSAVKTEGSSGYGTEAPISFAASTPYTLVGVWQGTSGSATADAVVYTSHVAGTAGTQGTSITKNVTGFTVNALQTTGNGGTTNLGFKGALISYGTLTTQETEDAEAWLHGV